MMFFFSYLGNKGKRLYEQEYFLIKFSIVYNQNSKKNTRVYLKCGIRNISAEYTRKRNYYKFR